MELQEQPNDRPEEKEAKGKALEKRVKKDRRCKSLLVSRIHDSQLEYIHDKESPKDIWDALHRVFERRSIASRMHLKRQMLSMRFEGGKLQQHFLLFDKLVREYRATGAALDDLDVVCHLLLTLGSSYSGVVTALETMPEENLSLEFVKCRLLDEETKRKGMELSTPSESDAAFYGTKPARKLKCFGCKKEGHKLADCPEKKHKQDRKQKQNSKANVAESGERKSVCFVSVRGANLPEENRTQWFIDSGATDHLVREKELFSELHRLKKPIEIAVAKDGETIRAEYSGTVKVVSDVQGKQIDCTIRDALYVPQLRCNLFSVLRVEQAGMRVVFEAGKVNIYSGSEIVACGSLQNKLYGLNFYSERHSAGNASMLSCGRMRKDFEIWHRRFGHLNEQSLKCLVRNEMVTGLKMNITGAASESVVCESCVVGKQTRKPFSSREGRKSSRVLELVHTDVCGPVTPVGLDGKKYFVTFIDDWSHFTVVYLLESKDEVAECFEEYEAFVTAKFERPISRLKCDNGGEYRAKRFKKFCKSKGIQIEWTVPYTPEQNGLSERMNRTLVEKARAMLDDSAIDRKFWGQAVLTAAYLTNRSPTSALEANQTPYELWESKKPDVSNIRVFGCDAYVHVPKELRRKLDAKAWKGTFVGYSHNGYRVWDPVKRTIVTARDVDFAEGGHQKLEKNVPVSSEQLMEVPSSIREAEDEERCVEDVAGEDQSDDEFNSFVEDEEEVQAPSGAQARDGRPQRTRSAPAWHKDFDVEYASFALNAMNFVEDIPNSIAELKKRDDWQKWKAAMDEEMSSMARNNTWTLVKLPPGRKAITSKWVFKVKRGGAEKEDRGYASYGASVGQRESDVRSHHGRENRIFER
ncbi:hypothetical protein RP20_CCG010088 [Aedes albopictus]|nr:hypothetical protein RP20_CCG010088 [Aedes albopictus]